MQPDMSIEVDGIEGDASLRALVRRLGEVTGRPPLDRRGAVARALEVQLLLDGINELGVDAESLARYGMVHQLTLPVVVLLIVGKDGNEAQFPYFDFAAWQAAIGTDVEDVTPEAEPNALPWNTPTSLLMVRGRGMEVLRHWVASAPLREVIDLVPPSHHGLEPVSVQAPDAAVEAYLWLWERYGNADLETWSDSSLRLEFQLRHRDWIPPFPIDVLSESEIEDVDLDRELASRFVSGPSEDTQMQLFAQLQEQAIGFLMQGRHRDASALFEFYLKQNPDSFDARNNLAFCLIPTATQQALFHLEAVRLSRTFNETVTVYNICFALALLGRHGEALDRAEAHWQRGDRAHTGSAYLWHEQSTGVELFYTIDVVDAFIKLGQSLAAALEEPQRVARWADRSVEKGN
jgi:hypothetical protein